MIRLDVQDYCQKCSYFEPELEKPQQIYTERGCFELSDMFVKCQYRKRCESIKRYLELDSEGENH